MRGCIGLEQLPRIALMMIWSCRNHDMCSGFGLLSARVFIGGCFVSLMKDSSSRPIRVDSTCFRHTGKLVEVRRIGKWVEPVIWIGAMDSWLEEGMIRDRLVGDECALIPYKGYEEDWILYSIYQCRGDYIGLYNYKLCVVKRSKRNNYGKYNDLDHKNILENQIKDIKYPILF